MKIVKDRRFLEYMGAFLLLGLVVFGVYLVKEHYVKENNLIFAGSYVEIVTDKSNYQKIKNFREVKEITTGLKGIRDSKMIFLTGEVTLAKNQVIAPSWLASDAKTLSMKIANNVYDLDIASYTGKSLYDYAISQEFYEELLNLTDERVYRITLKDYSKLAEFTKKLDEKVEGNVSGYEIKKGEGLRNLKIWQNIYKVTLGCLGIMLAYGLLLALSIIKNF